MCGKLPPPPPQFESYLPVNDTLVILVGGGGGGGGAAILCLELFGSFYIKVPARTISCWNVGRTTSWWNYQLVEPSCSRWNPYHVVTLVKLVVLFLLGGGGGGVLVNDCGGRGGVMVYGRGTLHCKSISPLDYLHCRIGGCDMVCDTFMWGIW